MRLNISNRFWRAGGPGLGVRHLQVLMTSSAVTVAYISRVNLSVAIVAMTSDERYSSARLPVYPWTEAQKSAVLGSFFWGYMVPQVAVGNVAEKCGSWWPMLVGMLLSGLLTAAVPFVAEYGYFALCLARVATGFSQGVVYPCCTVLLSEWIPPAERINAYSFTFGGCNIGTVIGLLLSGVLAASDAGWPSIFYVVGGICAGWCVLWLLVGASSPRHHPFISDAERSYIRDSCAEYADNARLRRSKKTPWFDMATSAPLWAILVCHCTHNWGIWVLETEMPNYVDSILGVNITQNGVLSCLPYLAGSVSGLIFPLIATKMKQKNLVSTTTNRKIWNSIAEWGLAAGLLILAALKSRDVATVVSLMTATVALNSGVMIGFLSNHVDLSPNFCGTLMGITNSFACIGAILGPLSVGWFVEDRASEEEWSQVFYCASGVMTVGNLIYLLLCSSIVQRWNDFELS